MKSKAFFLSMFLIVSLALAILGAGKLGFVPQLAPRCVVATSPNVGVYWDNYCSEVVEFIDWGKMYIGSKKNVAVYIRNEGIEPFYVDVSTSNWIPYFASDMLSLASSDIGVLDSGKIIESNFTLHVSEDATNISDFGFDIQVSSMEAQESSVFGNLDVPDWQNITVTNYTNYIEIDNADGFVWEFPKDKDKFNQIYENGTLIVKDEQWLLIGEDLKEDSYPIGKLEWEQPQPYHVIVTDYYQDVKKNNNFTLIYDFYGGFHPKITFNTSIGIEGNYTVDWRCWVHKLNTLNEPEKYWVKFWNENETCVVFNYRDVYESFGNITEVDVTGWFKGKRFDERFNVGYLNGTFTLDPTFGDISDGTSHSSVEDHIEGTEYASSEAGTANFLQCRVGAVGAAGNMKMALYKVTGKEFVAETEEVFIDSTGIKTFNFDAPKPSVEAINYIIVAWADTDIRTRYVASEAHIRHDDHHAYNDFPNPLVSSTSAYRRPGLCDYTPSAGEAYVADLSQSVSTTWSVLTEWDAIADFSQGLTTSWTVLTEWNAILDVTQTLATSWNVLANLNTFVDLSQAFSTTWNVLIQSSFNIVTSLSNTFTWTVDIYHWVFSGVAYTVDLSLGILTSWLVDLTYTPWIAEGPPTTFGTVAFVIAIIALAIGVVALTKKGT